MLIANELGTAIMALVLCDSAGTYRWAENVEPGQRVILRPVQPSEAADRLERLAAAHQPAFPEGYGVQYSGAWGMFQFSWTDVDQSYQEPAYRDSLLERNIRQAVSTDVRGGKLEPRTYVAITTTGPEVPLGYDRVREEASFHVLRGTW